MAKTSQIRFDVHLDDNLVPERIEWEADDQPGKKAAKSALIALWDEKDATSLRIDLWTKQMTTEEMKSFFHQNLLTLADTFERATGEKEMAGHMRAFGRFFGEKMLGIDVRDSGQMSDVRWAVAQACAQTTQIEKLATDIPQLTTYI